jgi:hypothetical protein
VFFQLDFHDQNHVDRAVNMGLELVLKVESREEEA